jgi:hypothetical protein
MKFQAGMKKRHVALQLRVNTHHPQPEGSEKVVTPW